MSSRPCHQRLWSVQLGSAEPKLSFCLETPKAPPVEGGAFGSERAMTPQGQAADETLGRQGRP